MNYVRFTAWIHWALYLAVYPDAVNVFICQVELTYDTGWRAEATA